MDQPPYLNQSSVDSLFGVHGDRTMEVDEFEYDSVDQEGEEEEEEEESVDSDEDSGAVVSRYTYSPESFD